MIYVEFVSVAKAKKYVPHATIARQSFANSHVMAEKVQIGRHAYAVLYNKVSRAKTRIYLADIKHMRTGR